MLGRWIGAGCIRYGVASLLLAVALGAILQGMVARFVFFAGDTAWILRELRITVATLGAFTVCGLIGYFRGRRLKAFDYMNYLMSALPDKTREAIVELAFGEAQRVGTEKAHRASP